MGLRMRKSFPRLEELSHITSLTIQAGSSRGFIHLFGSFRGSSELCSHTKRAGGQLPVFYTFKALFDAETRYPKIEKLILALVVAARKLRPYFQAHIVIVMTQYPLRSILHGPDASQRVMKWALELGQYGLVFRPRTVIKAQALADFVVEFTPSLGKATVRPNDAPKAAESTIATLTPSNKDFWNLHVDGASNYKGS
ncbi:hypothetical protein ACFX12_037766 [Malus domestica]